MMDKALQIWVNILLVFVTEGSVMYLTVEYFITTTASFLQPDLVKSRASIIKQGNLLSFNNQRRRMAVRSNFL